jgi:hypothetical protein
MKKESLEKCSVIKWGAIWYSKNKLDGVTEHIIFENGLPVLFTTKREIREFIKQKYGYIAKRKDLRAEPHGWRMPKLVKVKVELPALKTKPPKITKVKHSTSKMLKLPLWQRILNWFRRNKK